MEEMHQQPQFVEEPKRSSALTKTIGVLFLVVGGLAAVWVSLFSLLAIAFGGVLFLFILFLPEVLAFLFVPFYGIRLVRGSNQSDSNRKRRVYAALLGVSAVKIGEWVYHFNQPYFYTQPEHIHALSVGALVAVAIIALAYVASRGRKEQGVGRSQVPQFVTAQAKSILPTLVISAVVTTLVLGLLSYNRATRAERVAEDMAATQPSKPPRPPLVVSADWVTFESTLGFSIKHPPRDWHVTEYTADGMEVDEFTGDNVYREFSMSSYGSRWLGHESESIRILRLDVHAFGELYGEATVVGEPITLASVSAFQFVEKSDVVNQNPDFVLDKRIIYIPQGAEFLVIRHRINDIEAVDVILSTIEFLQ